MILAIVFSLASCGNKSTESPPSRHQIYAGVFWYDYSDAYLATVRKTLNSKFDSLGIKYENYNAASNKTEQISQISEAIANGVNVLIINIVDNTSTEMAQSIVNIANAVDVPIIFFNREIDDSVINSYENTCYVGSSAAEAGEKQGQMVGNYIVENYDALDLNDDGKISYIMMKGQPGSNDAELRTTESVKSANTTLTEAGKPELVYYDTNNTDGFSITNWSKDQAFEAMTTALSTTPMNGANPIEVVFANNDDMALGCIEALNNVGWNAVNEKSIPVFGIDYTADAETAIKKGTMAGSILPSVSGLVNTITTLAQNTVNGKNIFYSANKLFNVDEDCAKVRVPYEIVTTENAEFFDFSNFADLSSDDEDSDTSSDPDHPEQPSDSDDADTPSDSDTSKQPSDSDNSNDPDSSGSSGNSGNSGSSGNSGNSGNSNNPSTPSQPEPPDNTTSDVDQVAVFWYDFSDAYLYKVRKALDGELDTLGLTYTNYDADFSQATQNYQIDTAISQGADLLIVNIVNTASNNAAQLIVDKAEAADIPIIFFNREISDYVLNSYENACFVGVNASEAGEVQGQMAGEYITANYDAVDLNNDGKISYIMMKGELGNPEAESRSEMAVKFCNSELKSSGNPDLVYYDSSNTDRFEPSNWSKTTAYNLMTSALSTNPMNSNDPIEVVFANNDDAALGCVEALNKKGWNTGSGKSIPVFGLDYTNDAATAIRTGKMTGSVLQATESIAVAIAALTKNVVNGRDVFYLAARTFNVDDGSAKIRVPYEMKLS